MPVAGVCRCVGICLCLQFYSVVSGFVLVLCWFCEQASVVLLEAMYGVITSIALFMSALAVLDFCDVFEA